jgi:MFS family permease
VLELFAGRRGRVAAGLLVAEFTAATQSLIVTTVMPRIAADLHGLSLYGFASAALFGAGLIAMSFAGPIADRYGTRRVLAAAFALTLVGLLSSMFSPSMTTFVGARGIEGFGGGLDYAVSIAAIAKVFPEELRPRMFAWSSAMWIVPGLVGPALGAFIAATLGWRYVFAVFIPLVVLSAALVLPSLAGMEGARTQADPLGAVRVLLSRDALLLRNERSVAIAAFALLQAAFFGADAYVSLLLTAVRGQTLALAGICITLGVIGWTIGSSLQPRLLERVGTRFIVICSALLGIVALATLLAVAAGAPVAFAYIAWTIGGTAIGLSFATLTLCALAGFPEGSEGTASSATLLAGALGSSVGIFLCGLPITIAHEGGAPLSNALTWTFAIALAFSCALLVLALRLPHYERSQTES